MPPVSTKKSPSQPVTKAPAKVVDTKPRPNAAQAKSRLAQAVLDKVTLGPIRDAGMQQIEKLRAAARASAAKTSSSAPKGKVTLGWSGVSGVAKAGTGVANINSGYKSFQQGDKLGGGIAMSTGATETLSSAADTGLALAKWRSGAEVATKGVIAGTAVALEKGCLGLSALGTYVSGLETIKAANKGDMTTASLKGMDTLASGASTVTSLPVVTQAITGASHTALGEAAAASGGTVALGVVAAAAVGWGVGRAIGSNTGLDEVATNAMEQSFFGEGRRELNHLEIRSRSDAKFVASVDDKELHRLTKVAPQIVAQAVVGTLTEIETARTNGNSAALQEAESKLQRLRAAQRGELVG